MQDVGVIRWRCGEQQKQPGNTGEATWPLNSFATWKDMQVGRLAVHLHGIRRELGWPRETRGRG